MNIVITGGTGFIGQARVLEALELVATPEAIKLLD